MKCKFVTAGLPSEVIAFKRKAKAMVVSWTASSGGIVSEKGEVTLSPKAK